MKLTLGLLLLTCPVLSLADIVVFSSEAAFLAATGATAAAAIPNLGAVPSPSTLGTLTYSLGPGGTQLFFGASGSVNSGGNPLGQWSSLIPGHDIAISAREDLNVESSSPVYSLGFQFHEPSDPKHDTNGCFAPCVDSTFAVTLFSGATPVGLFTFNASDDVLAFVGVWSDTAFNRVEILEAIGGIDDEYYGQFYTGTTPIPEPSMYGVLGLGLTCLLVFSRRLRKNND